MLNTMTAGRRRHAPHEQWIEKQITCPKARNLPSSALLRSLEAPALIRNRICKFLALAARPPPLQVFEMDMPSIAVLIPSHVRDRA